jgi:hypothetical protein
MPSLQVPLVLWFRGATLPAIRFSVLPLSIPTVTCTLLGPLSEESTLLAQALTILPTNCGSIQQAILFKVHRLLDQAAWFTLRAQAALCMRLGMGAMWEAIRLKIISLVRRRSVTQEVYTWRATTAEFTPLMLPLILHGIYRSKIRFRGRQRSDPTEQFTSRELMVAYIL